MMDRENFMQHALELAKEASDLGEVPVGCVITNAGGNIIGRGRNRREECGNCRLDCHQVIIHFRFLLNIVIRLKFNS